MMRGTPFNSIRGNRLLRTAILAGLLTGAGGFAARQDPAGPAATAPVAASRPAAGAENAVAANTVIVTSVQGKARARTDPTAAWQKIEAGMRLPEGAQIQTGSASQVVCSIPPGREFIVDRLSVVTVLEASQRGDRLTTDLLMEYGRTDLRVQRAGREQDARIRTPGATASVRGTELSVYNQPPFAPELKTYTGVVDYRYAKRQLTVSRGGRSSGGRGSAETALLESVVDPSVANARTNADAALITQEVSRGAVLTLDPDIGIAEIRGGAGAVTDSRLSRGLPGRLNFVVRWSQPVDVDIIVAPDNRPFEEIFTPEGSTFNPSVILFPGDGLQTAPSGGRIPYNHRGGRNGGQEICFWQGTFPSGVYGFGAFNNSTTTPVDVRFNAFLEGEKVPMYTFDADFNLVRANGIRRTILPVDDDPDTPSSEAMIVPVPRSELFELIIPEVPDETLDGTLPAAAPTPGPASEVPAEQLARAEPGPDKRVGAGRKGKTAKPRAARAQKLSIKAQKAVRGTPRIARPNAGARKR